jgi:hypothetical protein
LSPVVWDAFSAQGRLIGRLAFRVDQLTNNRTAPERRD